MSFYFGKSENGYSTSRTHHSKRDKSSSNEKHSSRHSRKRSSSRDSDKNERKSYRKSDDRDHKEKLRETYRDKRDSSKPNSKFQNESMAGANLTKVDWDHQTLSSFQKEFYTEHPIVKTRSQEDINSFREKHQITVKGSLQPKPIFSFEEAQFPSYISEQISKKFQTPTPIQSQGWPAALAGYDVIGIAQTGSGKTLTFLLPGFVHINAQQPLKPGDGPIGLVLAPTRELAMQIQEECLKFGRNARISSACVFGGADRYGQQRELSRGNHIVVATPGRLLDFLEAGVINLRRVTYLVLDEADRMLDMGFEPQIRRIISQIRPDRQTLMWSATWPREVQRLALEFCREKPIHIVIGNNDLSVNLRIKQNIEVLDNTSKRFRITKLLSDLVHGSKVLIFCQTKKGADYLTTSLGSQGLSAISIHGDKSQSQRDYIMRQFKSGRTNILVATDLAARGLDVADIKYVINYDFPTHIEDYIHRVGRTGRAGRDGISYTFFTREDYKHAAKLIDILEETEQEVPDDLYRIARRPIPSCVIGYNGKKEPPFGDCKASKLFFNIDQELWQQQASKVVVVVIRPSHYDANSRSNPKPPQKPPVFSYSAPTQKPVTHPSSTNGYMAQDSKPALPTQPGQSAQPTSQQTQPPTSTYGGNYPSYFYPTPNSYPVPFNGYQTLDPQNSSMNQALHVMNYYSQMQAYYSLNNVLSQMDAKTDPSQQQAVQNLSTYMSQVPQPPK